MGYDMHMVEGEADGYFRLNVWGMGTMRQILHVTGCLDWSNVPQWPAVETVAEYLHCTVEQLEEAEPGSKLYDQYQEYIDRKVRGRQQMAFCYGWKFTSNDGWLVTPEECRVLAKALDELTLEQLMDGIQLSEEERTQTGLVLASAMLTEASEGEDAIAIKERHELAVALREMAGSGLPENLVGWAVTCGEFATYCTAAAERGGFRVW